MKDIIDVLVTGDVFTDLVFSGCRIPLPGTEEFAQKLTISPGGAANRAVAAARLGASTSLMTSFGDDPIGEIALKQLQSEPHLDLSRSISHAGVRTPLTVAITDGDDRAFVTYQESLPSPTWNDRVAVRTAFVDMNGVSDIADWALNLRKQGTIMCAGVGWDASGAWDRQLLDTLSQVDIVMMNEVEATRYTGTDSVDAALRELSIYVSTAIVTLGKDGVAAVDADGVVRVPSLPVHAIDPTGAGDIFSAAVMAGTAWGWSLSDSLRLASATAACSVRHPGGAISAPTVREIGKLLKDYDVLHRSDAQGWSHLSAWVSDNNC